ncbi:MAG: DUF3575 domain-containing protein [Bacteroidota bacterium]
MALPAFSQGDNAIKTNLVNFGIGSQSLSYERVVADNWSIQLTASHTNYRDNGTLYKGFGITPELRYIVFDEEKPHFAFVSLAFQYRRFDLQEYNTLQVLAPIPGDTSGKLSLQNVVADTRATANVFGLSVMAGREWVFNDRWAVEVFVGPAYNKAILTHADNPYKYKIQATNRIEGLFWKVGVSVGYVF